MVNGHSINVIEVSIDSIMDRTMKNYVLLRNAQSWFEQKTDQTDCSMLIDYNYDNKLNGRLSKNISNTKVLI